VEQLRGYMSALIERKRRNPAEDVLSDLAVASDEAGGATTYEDMAMLGAGLLFAGHETTVAAFDRGALLLLRNPEQREALQRDPELVSSSVEEILRHPMPTVRPSDTARDFGLPRWANADIEVQG